MRLMDEKMKKQEPPLPEEKADTMANAPATVTGLFSRSGFAATDSAASHHEAWQLLREADAKGGEAHAAPTTMPAAQPEENNKRQPEEQSEAGKAALTPRQADLTGIFRKVQLKRPADESAQSAERSSGASSAGHAEQGFTQMFQALSSSAGAEETLQPLQWKGPPQERDEASRLSSLAAQPTAAAPGEFTQLFQKLDKPGAGTSRAEPLHETFGNQAAPQFEGGFTQLLRTLSAEAETEMPAAPVLPIQAASAPGEFTRIISGSMLREAQGKTTSSAHQESGKIEAPAATSAVPASPAAMSMPMQAAPPQLQPPLAVPAAPSLPSLAPPISPAPVQAEAPAANPWQRYMPLLLIANFFLMFLVLILVVVVLLRH